MTRVLLSHDKMKWLYSCAGFDMLLWQAQGPLKADRWASGELIKMGSCTDTLPRPLCGVVPPMVTPLRERDKLDAGGLEKLIEHIVAGGVHGLFILGTTGEGPSVSRRLREELVERTCRQVNGRVPVLVGITDASFVESVALAHKAAEAGAQGLVLGPPYYFGVGQQELLTYLRHIVPQLPLPVLLYNVPIYSRPAFAVETVKAAAELPGVVGIKEGLGDMVYFRQLQLAMKDRPDFALFIGPEQLLAEAVLMGGHGGVCGGANLAPRLYVELYDAARAKDIDSMCRLHEKVMRINATILNVVAAQWGFITALKYALYRRGICSDLCVEPLETLDAAQRERIDRCLQEIGIGD